MNIEEKAKTKLIQSSDFLTTIKVNLERMSDRNRVQDDHPVDMLDPAVFFISVTYRDLPKIDNYSQTPKYILDKGYHSCSDLIAACVKNQSAFLKHILNQTVPNNHYPHRKKDYPVALCFIDFPNSKNSNPRMLEMPHTHAILIVPPKTLPRFYALMNDNFRLSDNQSKTRSIIEVHCEEVPSRTSDLEKVISYSSKFYRSGHALSIPEKDRSHLFCMYG